MKENSIEFYKEIFINAKQEKLFELNKPFIEELIAVKERLVSIRQQVGKKFILFHPTNPDLSRVPEAEKWLMKLELTYKDMTLALNKILGFAPGDEDDFLKDIDDEYKTKD